MLRIRMNPINKRVIVITGAVENLGSATAKAFPTAGHRTVLVDRSPDRLRAPFPELTDAPNHFLASGFDLSDPVPLGKLANGTLARFVRIDALVNTVGGFCGGKPVHEGDLADWDFLFNVKLRTTLLACRTVIPQMLTQKSGKIINVAKSRRFGSQGELRGPQRVEKRRATADLSPGRRIENLGDQRELHHARHDQIGRAHV